MIGSLLQSSERFAQAVEALEYEWGSGRWAVIRTLEAWDECALLRPRFRVVLPMSYAHYRAQLEHRTPIQNVSAEDQTIYAEIDWLLTAGDSSVDPEAPTVLDDPPPILGPFVRRSATDEKVNWDAWRTAIGTANGRPAYKEHVLCYYATSQRLRAYALLESYTVRAQLDPRQIRPGAIVSGGWDKSLAGRILAWTVGSGRELAVVDQLEREGWLEALYLVREVIDWARLRVQAPKSYAWAEGIALTPEERSTHEQQRVEERCGALANRWSRQEFYGSLRNLLELWSFATENCTTQFQETVRSDVDTAVEWAGFAFRVSRDELQAAVGTVGHARRHTIFDAVYPAWYGDRRTALMYLPDFVDAFNETIANVRLARNDIDDFLTFLDDHKLWAWYVEFAAVAREHAHPTDIASVQRFLRLRSAAIMTEEILVALADSYGTIADRKRARTRGAWDPMKVFLATRRDWRARVWQAVAERSKLVRRVTQESLSNCLDEIAALKPGTTDDGVVRLILAHVTVRNFGSHHLGRENFHLDPHGGAKIRAVVLTPLLYWKIATTLG